MRCPHCESTNIEIDAARGDAICTDCGAVLQARASARVGTNFMLPKKSGIQKIHNSNSPRRAVCIRRCPRAVLHPGRKTP